MSATHVEVQEISTLYTEIYCGYAACALLVYDWLLCLGQEVRFIWNWRSGVTVSSLVYAFSRYGLLIQLLLTVATTYPMSDSSCAAIGWVQVIAIILGTIAISVFSALRAYALSNRNIWLTAIIIFWALPPIAMRILQSIYNGSENLPSPFNCGSSTSLSPALSVSVPLVTRASQLTAELLVVGITWWYSYQSYRIRKGIKLGKTISSLLLYNGSLYFQFLATLCILDLIFDTASVSDNVFNAHGFLEIFFEPITSILTCHFMLSLRQFDSTIASGTYLVQGSDRVRGRMASMVPLEFTAQPSDSLPAIIASFAHPVHTVQDSSALSESEMDPDAILDDDGLGSEWQEMDTLGPQTRRTTPPSCESTTSLPAPNRPSHFEHPV